jgi:hypothetical protein
VEGRDDHLDAVVDDHLRPAEDMLLGGQYPGALACGGGREAVDELVDARCAERARGRARERLSPREPHAAGSTGCSDAIIRLR